MNINAGSAARTSICHLREHHKISLGDRTKEEAGVFEYLGQQSRASTVRKTS
jgi:hypothetical protein